MGATWRAGSSGKVVITGDKLFRQPFCEKHLPAQQANPSYGLTFWLNRQAPDGREADMERMIDLPWRSAEWTQCVHLQGRAGRHGRGAWLGIINGSLLFPR